jgi:hypothetical protein
MPRKRFVPIKGIEHLMPLSPSKTGNKRVQEYDDYEPGTESDESDESYNPPTGYSFSTGKENSPRKGRSRKKQKRVGKNNNDNKDSNHGGEKKPAAVPRPQRTPSSPFASPSGPKEATISTSVVHPSDVSDDGVVCSPVARANPHPYDDTPSHGTSTLRRHLFHANEGEEKKPAARGNDRSQDNPADDQEDGKPQTRRTTGADPRFSPNTGACRLWTPSGAQVETFICIQDFIDDPSMTPDNCPKYPVLDGKPSCPPE